MTVQGLISNILDEAVVAPLLVYTSAIELSTEVVSLILRIDVRLLSALPRAAVGLASLRRITLRRGRGVRG